MESLWNDADAARCDDALALRVYSSRLLGREPALVMHGGGNTSVKLNQCNILGEQETLLYVKGSGWDLATIEAAGFAPVKLDHLIALAGLPSLSDPQMVNELKTHTVVAGAPSPSVEAILHAILPYTFVDHSHADAIVTITNTADGKRRIEDIYGDDVVVIPYIMPGFDLARLCAEMFPQKAGATTQGMVLMNHGLFTFGETARESYERMIELVSRAENYLKSHAAWHIDWGSHHQPVLPREQWAQLRLDISKAAQFPCIVNSRNDAHTMGFCRQPRLPEMSQQGPATPDHIIRTKRLPMLGDHLADYQHNYQRYFDSHADPAKTMLDSVPRVILDSGRGMSCVGKNVRDAAIVQDIYTHTMSIIMRSEMLGGYQALPEKDLFDMEYWVLEQAKLKSGGMRPPLQGEVVLITGAASGIGLACVHAFRAKGAAVVALDINPAVTTLFDGADVLALACDLRHEQQILSALDEAALSFGGLDMAVLNAGVFPGGTALKDMDMAHWRDVQAVNLDANIIVMRTLHPLLKRAPRGGRVVIMGSKNVLAPGPGAAAYSASKAALNQVARITALEWAEDNIRVNTLHPDAVFDTGVWTDEVLQKRADFYQMSVQEYQRKNLLRTPVSSSDVAALACALCTDLFAKTTGAQIPVDGGNERVI